MRVIIFLLLSCFYSLGFSQNTKKFEAGNALYNSGKYNDAIAAYKAILNTNEHSAELYFNLGNANYKLNNIASSIYYYEKALFLNPNDKDIQNNLAFAKNMTIDAIEIIPEVGFSKLIKTFINTYSADVWAKIAVCCMLLFIVLFLIFYFSYSTSYKRIAFVTSIIVVLIGCISLVTAFQKKQLDTIVNPAIVFASESKVKADPNNLSEELFRLHEGTKINILETYNDWYKVELSDKSIGWIASEDVKLLNNF